MMNSVKDAEDSVTMRCFFMVRVFYFIIEKKWLIAGHDVFKIGIFYFGDWNLISFIGNCEW